MTSNNAIDARVELLLSAALAGHQADVGRPRPSPHRGASRQRAIAGGKTFVSMEFPDEVAAAIAQTVTAATSS